MGKTNSQRGQGLIETLILSLCFTILIHTSLLIFWIGVNVVWIEHQLYQGILCFAQHREERQCKEKVLEQIKRLNSLGKITTLQIKNFQKNWEGKIIWNFYGRSFLIQQNFILP